MRLLIVTEDPHEMIGNDIYTTNPVVGFFMSLSSEVERLRYCCPLRVVQKRDSRLAQKLHISKNTTIVNRPFFFHKKEIFKNPLKYIWSSIILFIEFIRADVVFYRIPTPFIIVLYVFSFFFKDKTVVYIAGDFFSRNQSHNEKASLKSIAMNFVINSYDFFERKIAKRYTCVATGKELCKKYGCSMFYTSLIPAKSISDVQRNLDKNNLKLLYVGRLDYNKGVQELLSVVEILKNEQGFNLTLTIVGDGMYRHELEDQATKLQILEQVKFKGAVPYGTELFDYFKTASIFILPSYSEGVPKVLFDAMSKGLPIIATNVGGIVDVVRHEETAILVEAHNHDEIIDAINRYFNEPELLERIVRQSLEEAENNSIEHRVKSLSDILKRQLN